MARVLVDANAIGDSEAAKLHDISTKTIQRYRKALADDLDLADMVRLKGVEAEETWHHARSVFLRRAIQKLDMLIAQATKEDIEKVIDALKAVGELEIAREALGVSAGPRREGEASAAPSGADATGADDGSTAPDPIN